MGYGILGANALGDQSVTVGQDLTVGDDLVVTDSLAIDGVTDVDRFRLGSRGAEPVAGDFVLSAGWGTTASVAITPNSRENNCRITITSSGTGQGANPTVTFTFPGGAWPYAPRAFVWRNGGSGLGSVVAGSWSGGPSTTALAFGVVGTPVSGSTYAYEFWIM